MAKDLKNGARSFKTQVVGSDSWQLTLNVKWLMQAISLLLGIMWAFWSAMNKIQTMEQELVAHKMEIEKLISHHQEQEDLRISQLEESVKWYETEMVKVGGVSLNPLSWKKKRGKNKD
tara:strand:+ start:144 stop:497 length:354 start_codon:yes stop_codon:yes gene_type:complete